MKLIMNNGNEYELEQVQYPDFIFYSEKPNEDFINVARIRGIDDKGAQPFQYKSIIINGMYYAPKFKIPNQ